MSREYKAAGRRLYINETGTRQYKAAGRRLYINETVSSAVVQFKRWTGSEWEGETLQVFLDGSWTVKPLMRWTGSEWVEVVCL